MHCPACTRSLSVREVGGVTVDACVGGCGGIWFDQFELEKFDEHEERSGEELLRIPRDVAWEPPLDAPQRPCPRCNDGTVMHQHFSSVKRHIEVDECPQCGGVFLDAGELAKYRAEFPTDAARDAAAQAEFSQTLDSTLTTMRKESVREQAQVRRVGRALRFLCPSYYIPGEQSWGAW